MRGEAYLFSDMEPESQVDRPESAKRKEDRFEEFWSVYPKKVGKPAALKNWLRAIKGGADPQEIIDGARRYAGSKAVADGFVKHPQGWLTDERWADDPPQQIPSPHVSAPASNREEWYRVER